MSGCPTKVSGYPNQAKYDEKTEPKVSITP